MNNGIKVIHHEKYDYLDLKDEKCPMTFVRTRLALEELPHGRTLKVELATQETCDNVEYSVTEFGDFDIKKDSKAPGIFTLLIKEQ